MAQNRINRINEEIKRELSALLRELKDPRLAGKLISVVKVDVSGDLSYANAYISVMSDGGEEVINALKAASGFIRREVFKRVRLRQAPQFAFLLDTSIEYGARINSLLKDLKDKEHE